jgi:hypothetical protein
MSGEGWAAVFLRKSGGPGFPAFRPRFADLPDEKLHRFQKPIDDRNLALLRLLALESALFGYHARHGGYPPGLACLAPECLAAIPRDPFTGAEFKYLRTPAGFAVYSPGPTGRDSGGTFGSWLRILCGEADLGLDMYDHDQW